MVDIKKGQFLAMILVNMIATVLKFQNKDLFKVEVKAFICYLLENSCFFFFF